MMIALLFGSVVNTAPASAQDDQQQQQIILPQQRAIPNAAQRYEIDAKRAGVDPASADALPRSREFLRIDSSYYVGHFYEGAYKYEHAADYLGYRNAAIPLERALRLIERDYKPELRTRTSDLIRYIPAFKYQIDYTQIAYYLMQCYMNAEETQQSWDLLQRVRKWNFQREYYMDFYNYMAWTIHRNRFYTAAKFPFLKNSIDENEALANKYLDSALRRININVKLNAQIFPPGYAEDERLAVYHYKCVLYSYQLKVDSAMMYFEKMRDTRYFPHNNYANFRGVCADFKEAEKEYKIASAQDAGDKRLQEWAYYGSIIDIYKANPKRAEALMRGMIRSAGSTPGYGWYQIALARALFYDGQMEMDKDESQRAISKAAEFKELHIGTTLGQSHYEFSIQLNKLMHKEAEWEMQKFQNANWWYNPSILLRMSGLQAERYLQQFLIINQFAQNPERDRVIYKLFSSESTVGWDEIWYLIRDFSTRFFIDKFEEAAKTDSRESVRKYFKFFVARLKMKQDKWSDASALLQEVLRDPTLDATYEQLLVARCYQALAECADELEQPEVRDEHLANMYAVYPQLIPYTGLKMPMQLTVTGAEDKAATDALRACNINFKTAYSRAPKAFVRFYQVGDNKGVEYYVLDANGTVVVPQQKCSYKKSELFGRTGLSYRLFGIGGLYQQREDDQMAGEPI